MVGLENDWEHEKDNQHQRDTAGSDTHAYQQPARRTAQPDRQRLAGAVNAELTRLYWSLGKRLHTEVPGDGRASYGTQLLDQLGQQLTQEFGRGFESRNLRRMVKFAESFPDAAIVSTLSAKLSWSHMVAIVALKTPQARQFYADQAATNTWSVRELAQRKLPHRVRKTSGDYQPGADAIRCRIRRPIACFPKRQWFRWFKRSVN
jgi:hypothetical protein